MIEIKAYKLQYLKDNWNNLCDMISIDNENNRRIYSFLTTMYSDPRRHYHNLNHIYDCLTLFDDAIHSGGIEDKSEACIINLAIWFHDVYYSCGYPTIDEEMSVKVLISTMPEKIDIPLNKVAKLIDLTGVHTSNSSFSIKEEYVKLFLDIDMSVLAYKKERYDEYVQNIMHEYRAFHPLVDLEKMLPFRVAFLNTLLKKKSIFLSSNFDALQKDAVENIKRELLKYNV